MENWFYPIKWNIVELEGENEMQVENLNGNHLILMDKVSDLEEGK